MLNPLWSAVFWMAALLICVVLIAPAAAQDGVPVPKFKPQEMPNSQVPAGFLDFKKAFTIFDKTSNQSPKPVAQELNVNPMPDSDIALYQEVFALQAGGKMDAANKIIAQLSDQRLLGHVLYQRYMHPTAYKASFDELHDWLAMYADHPGASKVYSLASKRVPDDFDGELKNPFSPPTIATQKEPSVYTGKTYISKRKRSGAEKQTLKNLKNKISSHIREGQNKAALQTLQGSKSILDATEYDILQAQVAAGYMFDGQAQEALRLATASLKRSKQYVPQAGWVAGLLSWREGHYGQAAEYFEVAALSPYASGWTNAAGSYWAARAHMRTGNVKVVSGWLEKATIYPRTFYGLLATRSLGRDFDFNWKSPTFTKGYYDVLASTPAGNRAMALYEVGQIQSAESELLRLDVDNKDQREALLAYAGYAHLPSLALRLGSAIPETEGVYYDSALYPIVPWTPANGYKIDPALIYAIARQESHFDPQAESPSGAVGIMQLMPSTARGIAREKAQQLLDPQTNIEIAQTYLNELLKDKAVKGDLMALVMAYNAGPGKLARWKSVWPEVDDPLLFIELIPSSETRAYVERVLANYWMYRMRGGLDTPTLDAIAAGRPAKYAEASAHDGVIKLAARK